jgi:hypothetical protein
MATAWILLVCLGTKRLTVSRSSSLSIDIAEEGGRLSVSGCRVCGGLMPDVSTRQTSVGRGLGTRDTRDGGGSWDVAACGVDRRSGSVRQQSG